MMNIETMSAETKSLTQRASILVVDDEDQLRHLIRETLEQAGYQVTEACDGKEALQQYRLAPADLVIMDKNPLDNIRNSNTVKMVMKNGRLYEADSLDELYPEVRKAPAFEWQQAAPTGVPGIKK